MADPIGYDLGYSLPPPASIPNEVIDSGAAILDEMAERAAEQVVKSIVAGDTKVKQLERKLKATPKRITSEAKQSLGKMLDKVDSAISEPVTEGSVRLNMVEQQFANPAVQPNQPPAAGPIPIGPPGLCWAPDTTKLSPGSNHLYITFKHPIGPWHCHYAFYCIDYTIGDLPEVVNSFGNDISIRMVLKGKVWEAEEQFNKFYWDCVRGIHPFPPAGDLWQRYPFGRDCDLEKIPPPPTGDDTPPGGDDTIPDGDDTPKGDDTCPCPDGEDSTSPGSGECKICLSCDSEKLDKTELRGIVPVNRYTGDEAWTDSDCGLKQLEDDIAHLYRYEPRRKLVTQAKGGHDLDVFEDGAKAARYWSKWWEPPPGCIERQSPEAAQCSLTYNKGDQ